MIILLPRWLWFDLFLDTRILPNQRGFFNLFDIKISINSGIGEMVYPGRKKSCFKLPTRFARDALITQERAQGGPNSR